MDLIKKIIFDSLNGMSLDNLPLFIFQILMAGLMAHIFQIFINKKTKSNIINNGGLLAVSICVLASIVKYSLPFSILGLGVLLLLKSNKEESALKKNGFVSDWCNWSWLWSWKCCTNCDSVYYSYCW